jgi:hypothetical protein
MARIAEDLLLLLLDNGAARPALDHARRRRILSAAVLLDLAYACRIRPSEPDDPVPLGRLIVLTSLEPGDSVLTQALQLLSHKPITPADAIAKLRAKIEPQLLERLVRDGHINHIQMYTKGFRRREAWPLTDRSRPAAVRAAMLAVLFDDQPPNPSIAAIISLLVSVDGLRALLSLDERGWQWVNSRAGEIASGSWVNESIGQMHEVNLAVTTALVRAALM